MEDSIYSMSLHDDLELDSYTTIRRVPGGWIYYFHTEANGGWTSTGTFVAFHNEFIPE